MKNSKKLKKKKGFTLVELIVVIAIIIILAALAVPRVTQYIDDARNARSVSDITSMYTAVTASIAEYQATATEEIADGSYDIGAGTEAGTAITTIKQNLEESRPANITVVAKGSETNTAFSVTFDAADGLISNVTISSGTHKSVDGATPVEIIKE